MIYRPCDKCGSTRNGFIPGRSTCVNCEAAVDAIKHPELRGPLSVGKTRPVAKWERRDFSRPGMIRTYNHAALTWLLQNAAAQYGVTLDDLLTNRGRTQSPVMHGRWFFWWTARILTWRSLVEISDVTSHDHSTVYYAISRLDDQSRGDDLDAAILNASLLAANSGLGEYLRAANDLDNHNQRAAELVSTGAGDLDHGQYIGGA